VKSFKKAIQGRGSDTTYDEYRLMQEMSWSYEDLMNCPYEKFLEYKRIMSLETKEKKKKQKSKSGNING